MPQTTPELAAKFPGMDREAMEVLRDAGYTLTREWFWLPPSIFHEPIEREADAINYLIEEWDFGGLIRKHEEEE